MSDTATQELCGCLRRIATLLEKGEPVEAATLVVEMNEILPRVTPEMPGDELADARALLEHCAALEGGLRQHVLSSLQRLGATRKGLVYRQYGSRP
jgi:uncharacterized membrane-anchored protein